MASEICRYQNISNSHVIHKKNNEIRNYYTHKATRITQNKPKLPLRGELFLGPWNSNRHNCSQLSCIRESFKQVEGACFNKVGNLTVEFVALSAALYSEQASSALELPIRTDLLLRGGFNGRQHHHSRLKKERREEEGKLYRVQSVVV